jgi:excisionase family DNA binding protein
MKGSRIMSELLSIGEASKLMGVCENTLRDWDIEKKFIPHEKTRGGHRRYSLQQIREYLDKNQKIENPLNRGFKRKEKEKEEMLTKWADYTDECETKEDKINLSVLLNNNESLRDVIANSIFSSNQSSWLIQQSWLRCRFKNLVNIQAMSSPASMITYGKTKGETTTLISEAVGAKTFKLPITIFTKADFESIKEAYADGIAQCLDNIILDELLRANHCDIEHFMDLSLSSPDALRDLAKEIDYFIGPASSKKVFLENEVDFFEIDTLLNEETFTMLGAYGKYPKKFQKPIFCPYILLSETPSNRGGFRNFLIRYGSSVDEPKKKKD